MSSSQGIWLCYSWEKILVYFGTKENGARGDEGSTFKNQTKNKKQKNREISFEPDYLRGDRLLSQIVHTASMRRNHQLFRLVQYVCVVLRLNTTVMVHYFINKRKVKNP